MELDFEKQARLVREWESLYQTMTAKMNRIEELKEAGRYGYQLRMPKKSANMAWKALNDFEKANGMEETK